MTLSSTVVKKHYDGDDSTVAFPTTFIFWDNTDIEVILLGTDDIEVTWVEGTHYTLTGGDGELGTVTAKTTPTDYTPATGERLTIRSNIDDTQGSAMPLGGAFPSTTVEEQFDKNVRLTQQLSEEISRVVKVSKTSSVTDLEIPDPVEGEIIIGNSSGSYDNAAPLAGSVILNDDTMGSGSGSNDQATSQDSIYQFVKTQFETGAWVMANKTLTDPLIVLGSDAAGDIMYNNGTKYIRLPKGTEGQALLMNPGETAPIWRSGAIIQHVYNQDSAVATGATAIPLDDTIPQNTEGDQYMSQTITPTSATSILKIEVCANIQVANQYLLIHALFQNSIADAIFAMDSGSATTNTDYNVTTFTHYMVAGSTSAITIKYRAGGSTAITATFNGSAGSRRFGGVSHSSMSITEIAP